MTGKEQVGNVRVVFMGSPAFAVPTLEALAEHFRVIGVVSQPDRIRGRRGGKSIPTAVKEAALELNIPVMTPEKLNTSESFAQLKVWNPDIIVVVAYSKLLKENVLTLPRLGCINLHPSLLPLYRGPSPIQAALLNGDDKTGNTTFLMAKGYDTGDILLQEILELDGEESFSELMNTLGDLGADLVVQTVRGLHDDRLTPRPQTELDLAYTQKIEKEDACLSWSEDAVLLARQVRAYYEFPGAYFYYDGKMVKVGAAVPVKEKKGPCGTILEVEKEVGFTVACGEGALLIKKVKPPGKPWMSAWSYLQSRQELKPGFQFTEE